MCSRPTQVTYVRDSDRRPMTQMISYRWRFGAGRVAFQSQKQRTPARGPQELKSLQVEISPLLRMTSFS